MCLWVIGQLVDIHRLYPHPILFSTRNKVNNSVSHEVSQRKENMKKVPGIHSFWDEAFGLEELNFLDN